MTQSAFFMDSSFSCSIAPHAGNIVYWFRANGANGAQPTVSDGGATFNWHYRDPTKAAFTGAVKYWPDYDSSMLFNGNGIICDPSVGDANFPFRTFGRKDDSWSHMMRVIVPVPANVQLKNVGINNTDWGTIDMMYSVGMNYEYSNGRHAVGIAWNDGTGTSGGNWGVREIRSALNYPVGTPLEILATRDAPSKTTYLFVNGTLIGSFVGNPRDSVNADALKVATAGSANTGSNMYAGDGSTFYLNDEYLWNTCIATSSYTPSIQPYC